METDLLISEKQLTELCRGGAYQEIAAGLAGQKGASKLAKTALKVFRELAESGGPEQRVAIVLAVLHTTSDSELSKLRFWPGYFHDEIIKTEYLRSVPRERMQIFAEQLLNTSERNYPVVMDLYNCGLIDKPIGNGYVGGIICNCSWRHKNSDGLLATLRALPGFLTEDVWLLFQYDGTAESCLASADKYLTNAQESWEAVLVKFADEGLLDRARLLDESLKALSRDFNQHRAGWFSRFHEALKPTAKEQAQRLQLYLPLLHSAVAPTVSFAMSALVAIDKAAPIAFGDLSGYLGSALASKSKQTAIAALKLLGACAEREPASRGQICSLACEAFVSTHAEVQSKAIELIAKYADAKDTSFKSRFAEYAPSLSASVKKSVPAFLQTGTAGVPPASEPEGAYNATLHKPTQLQPIPDLNGLVLKAAYVLEHPEAYTDYELVLDGILRFSKREGADFEVRTSSLLQRARKLSNNQEVLIRTLCRIIIVWLADELTEAKIPAYIGSAPLSFPHLHQIRMDALAKRVQSRDGKGLLCLPTDEFGWIENDALKQRPIPEDPWDRAFAILRMRSPDAKLIDTIGHGDHPAIQFARAWRNFKISPDKPLLEWSVERDAGPGNVFTPITLKPCFSLPFQNILTLGLNDSWRMVYFSDRGTGPEILLKGSLMPSMREPYYARGVRWLSSCLQYRDVQDKAGRFFLHFLKDPSVAPGKQGSLLLALSVSTEDQDISVAGIDTFIMLIDQKRFDFDSAAEAMHRLYRTEDCIKSNRWLKNFGAIAKASANHSKVVYELIQEILSTPLNTPPKDLHNLLELLVELNAEIGGKLKPGTLSCLKTLKSSGKTKKLLDQLIS